MQIINAEWEKRNIGCDVCEIILSERDIQDADKILIKELYKKEYKDKYKVIKIPVCNIRLVHMLEDLGFRFMEDQLTVSLKLSNFIVPKQILHFKNTVSLNEVEKKWNRWSEISDLISDNMFTTDRIYLDPLLKTEISRKRYQNWLLDSFELEDVHLFITRYNGQCIGFYLDRWVGDDVHSILGGLFEDFHHQGLGKMQYLNWILYYMNLDKNSIITNISSNNIAVLNIYMLLKFSIVKQMYVFRKYM